MASIKFDNPTSNPIFVQFYENAAQCTDRVSVGRIKPQEKQVLTISSAKKLAFTVSMDFGEDKYLSMGAFGAAMLAANPHIGCNPTLDFEPTVDSSYVFKMTLDDKNCSFKFENEKELRPEVFNMRHWIRPFGESGPFCEKQ